jgi:hypothetical protein
MYMTLSPAYGRDYKSAASAVEAWRLGRDFIIEDIVRPGCGLPVSIESASELKAEGVTNLRIRYNRLTRVTCVSVDGGKEA